MPPFTGPRLWGLEILWRERQQPNITCSIGYYPGENITFVWQIERRDGNLTTLPGYMGTPSFDSPLDANYFSALDYIFSIDDIQSILRCMVHVDDKTRGSYEAKVEELIPSYGKCNDTTIVPTYIAGCG